MMLTRALTLLALFVLPLPAQMLRGRVLSPAGEPLVASLRLVAEDGPAPVTKEQIPGLHPGQVVYLSGRSSAKGNFVLDLGAAPPGQRFVLWVSSSGFADLKSPGFDLPTAELDLGALHLQPGLMVRGQVLDPRGKAVPGAEVRVMHSDGPSSTTAPQRLDGWRAETGADGRFQIAGLPTGSASVQVLMTGCRAETKQVRLEPRVAAEALVFGLQASTAADPVVWIRDPEGEPVAGARLLLGAHDNPFTRLQKSWPQRRQTVVFRSDAKGRVVCTGFGHANLPFSVRAPGFDQHVGKLSARAPGAIDVVLKRRPRIRLRVLSATGSPLPRFWVQRVQLPNQRPHGDYFLPCIRDGVAWIPDLPGVPCALHIRARRHAETLLESVQAGADEAKPLAVEMERGATLSGKVFGPDARLLVGQRIEVQLVDASEQKQQPNPILTRLGLRTAVATRLRCETDAQGQFTIRHLRAGDLRLSITSPDSVVCYRSVRGLKDAESRRLADIRLAPGARCEVLVSKGGKPHAGVGILIHDAGGGLIAQGKTDAKGRYVLPSRLGLGDYRASCMVKDADNPLRTIMIMQRSKREFSVKDVAKGVTLRYEDVEKLR